MNSYPIKTPKQLGAVLRGFRKARAMTQVQAGARVGFRQRVISDLEQDPSNTTLRRVFKLLAALDLEIVLRDRQPAEASRPEW
jgi:HTH-type transcriptional regulator/antitoxin HipB